MCWSIIANTIGPIGIYVASKQILPSDKYCHWPNIARRKILSITNIAIEQIWPKKYCPKTNNAKIEPEEHRYSFPDF